jgi:excisionase family DNA binding protein
MSERLLTVEEAAAALSLNVQTVRVWLRNGKLRGLRTDEGRNGRWRVPESALVEALTPHTPKPI